MNKAARNRILPVSILAIWAISAGIYLGTHSTLSKPVIACFLALLTVVVLVGFIFVERVRNGYYTDAELLGTLVAVVVAFAVFGFGSMYMDSFKVMGIILMITVALGRWVIVGTKPSGIYNKLVQLDERRHRRLTDKRRSDSFTELFDASSDEHDYQPVG